MSSLRVGCTTTSPSMSPTRTAPTGPSHGMSDTARAAEAEGRMYFVMLSLLKSLVEFVYVQTTMHLNVVSHFIKQLLFSYIDIAKHRIYKSRKIHNLQT